MSNDLFGQPLIEGKQRSVPAGPILIGRLDDLEYQRSGGFQNHTRETRRRIVDGLIHFDDAYIGATWRYAHCYGRGGWQDVCKMILRRIERGEREEFER